MATNLVAYCSNGNLRKVKKIVETKGRQILLYDKNLPLRIACSSNQLEIVKYILSLGFIDVTKPYNDAIIRACQNTDNVELVKLLIEHGADPNVEKGTCIISAINYNNINIVKYLLTIVNIDDIYIKLLSHIVSTQNMEMHQLLLNDSRILENVLKTPYKNISLATRYALMLKFNLKTEKDLKRALNIL